MRADDLARLLEIRRGELDGARHGLADALATESQAERAVAEATARLAREADLALAENGGDATVEAYVRWLPLGRRALTEASARRDRAMEGVALARAALALAAASERAVEQVLRKRQQEEAGARSRRETATLDEIAGRRHSAPSGTPFSAAGGGTTPF